MYLNGELQPNRVGKKVKIYIINRLEIFYIFVELIYINSIYVCKHFITQYDNNIFM